MKSKWLALLLGAMLLTTPLFGCSFGSANNDANDGDNTEDVGGNNGGENGDNNGDNSGGNGNGGTTGGTVSGGNGNGGEDEVQDNYFPFLVDPAQATYSFETEQMTTPYFLGNVIYNETVLLEEDNKGVISGKLQYAPVKILSVRDYTWENEYAASNYTVSSNVITMNAGGEMPYWGSEYAYGEIPEPYRQVSSITNVETDWVMMGGAIYTEGSLIYGHQISVSYVYDVNDLQVSDFPTYESSGLTKTKAKLTAGEDLKITVIGDSVAEGCSSSAHFNHAPYMENWATQSTNVLNATYEGDVTMRNVAVGGKTSEWGANAAQINSIVQSSPDLVIIHFGINDAGSNYTRGAYHDNIEKIVSDVQARLPDCEFMLIKAFTPNELNYNGKQFEQYWAELDEIASGYEGVYTMDMYTQSKTMLQTKKYMDVTGNGVNHVNDYSSRLYTMSILSSLIDYKAKN